MNILSIFTGTKIYLYLIGAAIFIAGAIGLKLYIDHENSQIANLTKQVAMQQVAINQDQQAIELTQKDLAGLKLLTDGFNKQIATIQANANRVTTTFNSKAYQSTVKSNPTQAASQISTEVNSLFSDVNNASRAPIGASDASN
ncbi:hypothetical protein [Burkholderia multivorans]|uniref:hypothetical protein n=1 Tax=Burkholderia multivorans TaxID=87883 RepID=UPI00158C98E8|nr:hypothetical protein [Burkholderia multivorans]